MEKSKNDLLSSIKLIQLYLNNYYDGHTDCYKSIAVELRKLLCDKNPLLPRVHPEIKLHKLNLTKLKETSPSLMGGLVLSIAGSIYKNEKGKSSFDLKFANPFELISVKDWVNQSVLSTQITIFQIIKSIADKEAAHSDPEYDKTLLFTKSLGFIDTESHIPVLIGISEYILKFYKKEIETDL